jgi:hypothetical protein
VILDLSSITYIPILSVRPAEMIGLRELPESAKRQMLPHVLFRPWLGGGTIKRAIEKVTHSCSNFGFVIELDSDYHFENQNDVAQEIGALRSENNGFANWINFVREIPTAIPCLQVSADIDVLRAQVLRAAELNRGIVVRIPKYSLAAVDAFCTLFSEHSLSNVLFVLDFQQTDSKFQVDVHKALQAISNIRSFFGSANIAISSTSFPSTFKGVSEQEIYERNFYNALLLEADVTSGLIYSDRGSARMPQEGGGGIPSPRIDLPGSDAWYFFRKEVDASADKDVRLDAYKEMADLATRSSEWNPRLNIWGTQMIKLTQLRNEFGITSPVRATSARINIHLFKQALRTSRTPLSQLTEDDWSDL